MPNPAQRGGWEPDTPITDSLLRQFLVNWTLSIEAQGLPLGARTLRRDDLAAVDVGRPSFGGNVATLLAPLFPEGAPSVTAALDEFYGFSRGDRSGTTFIFCAWPTPNLRPYGWTLLGHEPLMLRPPGGAAPPDPSGLRIEEACDEAGLHAFETAVVRGFASPDLEALGPGAVFSPDMLSDGRYRFWVGWEGDRPVAAASAFTAAGINNVTIVATVPAARRRGYGAAVTWRATLADPALPALLLATDEGRPVYERMGYLSLFRFALWARDRPGGASR
jgi:hypothetical protein